MQAKTNFKGFPKGCVKFLAELKQNNSREWFAEHKADFENQVMAPAKDFVFEMGKRLKALSAGIVADPRINGSIFRPYRDTRFSKDKTPYKTHLGIFFWEGEREKMECPGYYFHLEPPYVMLGAGIHCFSKLLLTEYRDSVVHPKYGESLNKALKAIEGKSDYVIGLKHFKKTPRGYDPQHKNAELLLYNGLTSAWSTRIPDELYTKAVIDYCFKRFKDMAPLQKWLLEMTRRVDK